MSPKKSGVDLGEATVHDVREEQRGAAGHVRAARAEDHSCTDGTEAGTSRVTTAAICAGASGDTSPCR